MIVTDARGQEGRSQASDASYKGGVDMDHHKTVVNSNSGHGHLTIDRAMGLVTEVFLPLRSDGEPGLAATLRADPDFAREIMLAASQLDYVLTNCPTEVVLREALLGLRGAVHRACRRLRARREQEQEAESTRRSSRHA